jgi:Xaa-Pro aminopeptidase
VKDSRIGIDARMISHEKASLLSSKLSARSSKLVYPPQNLVDLVWKDKPTKSRDPIFIQPTEFSGKRATSEDLWSDSFNCTPFSGKDAATKLDELRSWLKAQPASVPSYSKAEPTASQMQVGTLITSLPCIGEFQFAPQHYRFVYVRSSIPSESSWFGYPIQPFVPSVSLRGTGPRDSLC